MIFYDKNIEFEYFHLRAADSYRGYNIPLDNRNMLSTIAENKRFHKLELSHMYP